MGIRRGQEEENSNDDFAGRARSCCGVRNCRLWRWRSDNRSITCTNHGSGHNGGHNGSGHGHNGSGHGHDCTGHSLDISASHGGHIRAELRGN